MSGLLSGDRSRTWHTVVVGLVLAGVVVLAVLDRLGVVGQRPTTPAFPGIPPVHSDAFPGVPLPSTPAVPNTGARVPTGVDHPIDASGINGGRLHRQAVIARIVDGDTVVLTDTTTVRLLGIDTPELHAADGGVPDCGAVEATDALKAVVPVGAPVVVESDARADHTDRFGRTLARVLVVDPWGNTTDAGLRQIETGWARAWVPGGAPRPETWGTYIRADLEARLLPRGVHRLCPGR